MTDATTDAEPRPIDWTAGGSKPEREGERCENPLCRQVLMAHRPGRKYCAKCDADAGRNPHDELGNLG